MYLPPIRTCPGRTGAAQFAPFAALTGYGEMIQEQNRLTRPEKELSEEVQEALQRKLHFLGAHIREQPKLHVVWFQKDAKKPEVPTGTVPAF